MDAEWSVEAGADDPVITVPWSDPHGAVQFVDARQSPASIDEIPEAQAHPELRACLQLLNAPDGYTWTAKCDAWSLGPEEMTAIAEELDTEPAAAGFGLYVDLLLREHAGFCDFRTHERTVRTWTQAAAEVSIAHARAEFVIRPACVEGVEGFAITAYVFALGRSKAEAYQRWASALQAVRALISARPADAGDGTIALRASSSIG